MPRKSRIDAPGALQHVIARGINRQRIFPDDADKNSFLDRLYFGSIWQESFCGKKPVPAICGERDRKEKKDRMCSKYSLLLGRRRAADEHDWALSLAQNFRELCQPISGKRKDIGKDEWLFSDRI
jgi:hypothetical protein